MPIRFAYGQINGYVISCMDFDFIGGSMGSVVRRGKLQGMTISLPIKNTFSNDIGRVVLRMMEAGFHCATNC